MTTSRIVRMLGRLVLCLLVLLLPLVNWSGQLWVLAIVSAVTIYGSARSSAVFGMIALLIAIEVVYGTPVGISSIAYIIAVLLFMMVGRFIAMPGWSVLEGWRFTDVVRTIVVSWVFYGATAVLTVIVGDVLYHSGFAGDRLRLLWNTHDIIGPFIIVVLTCVALRRMAVPFRRVILFGT